MLIPMADLPVTRSSPPLDREPAKRQISHRLARYRLLLLLLLLLLRRRSCPRDGGHQTVEVATYIVGLHNQIIQHRYQISFA